MGDNQEVITRKWEKTGRVKVRESNRGVRSRAYHSEDTGVCTGLGAARDQSKNTAETAQ